MSVISATKKKSDSSICWALIGVAIVIATVGVLAIDNSNARLHPKRISRETPQTTKQSAIAKVEQYTTNDVNDGNDVEVILSQDFANFKEWVKVGGVKSSELVFKEYTPQIRGVVARNHVNQYEVVMSVPRTMMLTEKIAYLETSIGQCVFANKDKLYAVDSVALTTYILETRRDPNHKFQPYYNVLPKDLDNFPTNWGAGKLKWLEGSPLLVDIKDQGEVYRENYEQLLKSCPGQMTFSFDEYTEARLWVASRCFSVMMDGEETTVLVPNADMANHARPRESAWKYDQKSESFVITTLVPLDPGPEITISYGGKSNADFFIYYGFALSDSRGGEEDDGARENPNDVRVNITLASADNYNDKSLAQAKLNYFGPTRTSHEFRMSEYLDQKYTSNAFQYLRILAADTDEMAMLIPNVQVTQGIITPHNEAASLDILARNMRTHLARYPATYDANMELLNSGTLKPYTDRHTALLVIISEQEVCSFWIYASEILIPLLRQYQSKKEQSELITALKALPRGTLWEKDLGRYVKRLVKEIESRDPNLMFLKGELGRMALCLCVACLLVWIKAKVREKKTCTRSEC